jgi:hypothetical protein
MVPRALSTAAEKVGILTLTPPTFCLRVCTPPQNVTWVPWPSAFPCARLVSGNSRMCQSNTRVRCQNGNAGGFAGLPSPVLGVRPVVSQPSHGLQRSPKVRPGQCCWWKGLALSRLFPSSDVTSQSTIASSHCNSTRYTAKTEFAVNPSRSAT